MISKPLLWIAHQLLWLVPMLMVVLFYGNNRKPARHLPGGIEFAPSRIVFGAWLIIVVCLVYAVIDSLKHSQGKLWNLAIAACTGFLALAILSSFPGTVVITSDGLQQVYWFQKNKHIRWGEIVEINTGKKNRTVTITGADGTKIVHSQLLADRPRLLLELKQHCGENLPSDFPREPIAGL